MHLLPNVFNLTQTELVITLANHLTTAKLSRIRRGVQCYTEFKVRGGSTCYRIFCNPYGILTVVVYERFSFKAAAFRLRSALIDREWICRGLRRQGALANDLAARGCAPGTAFLSLH